MDEETRVFELFRVLNECMSHETTDRVLIEILYPDTRSDYEIPLDPEVRYNILRTVNKKYPKEYRKAARYRLIFDESIYTLEQVEQVLSTLC